MAYISIVFSWRNRPLTVPVPRQRTNLMATGWQHVFRATLLQPGLLWAAEIYLPATCEFRSKGQVGRLHFWRARMEPEPLERVANGRINMRPAAITIAPCVHALLIPRRHLVVRSGSICCRRVARCELPPPTPRVASLKSSAIALHMSKSSGIREQIMRKSTVHAGRADATREPVNCSVNSDLRKYT